MDKAPILILSQFVSCSFMVGLIWTVQLLHYPGFSYVAEQHFAKFHSFHTNRITYVVLPVMLVEIFTAIGLVFLLQFQVPVVLNAMILIIIWLCTFLLSVPLHNSLSEKKNLEIIRRLVLTNWLRTGLWTLRLAVLTYVILLSIGIHCNVLAN